jgi:hypothetical protein
LIVYGRDISKRNGDYRTLTEKIKRDPGEVTLGKRAQESWMSVAVKSGLTNRLPYWEIIADNLSKAGWSWGRVLAVDFSGQTIFVADAHRGDGKRFVVRADEKLAAFISGPGHGYASRRWPPVS